MHRIRAAVAFAVATALVGCADRGAIVRSAADRWEAACGRRPEPTAVVWSWSYTIRCGLVQGAVGCTTIEGRVTVASRAENIPDVVLHELGHVLGGGHLDGDQYGVMVGSLSSSRHTTCLTQADLDAAGCLVSRPECRVLPQP